MGDLRIGHVLDVLAELPAESVHCVVTSPPYWGLRKYAGEQDVVWPDGSTSPYGLEPTIAEYVSHTVEILRGVRRVLRDDGVCFWNIADSYSGSGKGIGSAPDPKWEGARNDESKQKTDWQSQGLKPKDLCLIPFRVALAAQDDGWYVRSVIIWSKPNPMPESVRDRPTTAHEYILLLTKGERYYWDGDAVREPHQDKNVKDGVYQNQKAVNRDEWAPREKDGLARESFRMNNRDYNPSGRNLRTVWTFPTRPYPEAHFATFPPELPRKCILAGSPVKACAVCGKGWARVVEVKGGTIGRSWHDHEADEELGQRAENAAKGGNGYTRRDLGFRPACTCGTEETKPAVILDPFAGSGTTLAVAKELGRDYIGIEIAAEYLPLIERRLRTARTPIAGLAV